MIGLTTTSRLLKALADETRLRVLNLLAQEELSGTDLMEILNLGQSRVSTHLALLKEVGLVTDRRHGRRSLYCLAPGPAAAFVHGVLAENRAAPEFESDLAGLEGVRDRRRDAARAFFDRVAADFDEHVLPGRTWEGLARALLQIAPRGRYADLGVGDGLLTLMLAEIAHGVTAVDISANVLEQLRVRAKAKGLTNIETLQGEIESLPLPDASYDVVVMSQALHHAHEPAKALAEARRALIPGGRLLVIDLLAHNEDWVREQFGHVHLGFTESGLAELLEQAGLERVHVQRAARDPHPPNFLTLVATGLRPHRSVA